MAYSSAGFIWDNVLAHGKTLRDYGEFTRDTVDWKDPKKRGAPSFLDCLPRLHGRQTGLIRHRSRADRRVAPPVSSAPTRSASR